MSTRYIAVRINGDGTDTIIDPELPLSNVTYKLVNNGATEISATISPDYAYLFDVNNVPILQKWSTAIFVETDDQIRAGGIFVDDEKLPGDWDLDIMGYAGYPNGMPYVGEWGPPSLPWLQDAGATAATIWRSVYAVNVDPLDAFRKVWSHLQGAPRGNLGVIVDNLDSGIRVGSLIAQGSFDTINGELSFEYDPIRFSSWDTNDLGTMIATLSESTPFDFQEYHEWNADRSAIIHRMRLAYPRFGRRRDDVRFVFDENVKIASVQGDGDDYASEVLGLGAGEERTMLQARAVRSEETRIRRVKVLDQKDAKTAAAINTAAQAELKMSTALDEVTAITTMPGNDDLDSISPGDEIRVLGNVGYREIDLWVKIVSVSVTPDGDGTRGFEVIRADKITG